MSVNKPVFVACCWIAFLGSAQGYQSGHPTFSKFASIAISHARAGSSDLLNFPLLVSGTYSQLSSAANGGYVTSASGYDVVFGTDSACANRLSWETEYWDVNGKVVYWVNIPVLSHANDNLIYLCVGSTVITTDQSAGTATWNANYAGVWHLANGALTDATSNGNNWVGGTQTAGTGVMDGDAIFNNSQSLLADNASLHNQTFSLEMWLNFNSLPNTYIAPVGKGFDWILQVNSANQIGLAINNNYWAAADYLLHTGWTHLVWTYDGANVVTCYADGTVVNTRTGAGAMNLDNAGFALGTNPTASYQYFNGQLDELRLSNVALPANWIAATYANESNPSSFYSLNFPIPGAIATGSPVLW